MGMIDGVRVGLGVSVETETVTAVASSTGTGEPVLEDRTRAPLTMAVNIQTGTMRSVVRIRATSAGWNAVRWSTESRRSNMVLILISRILRMIQEE